MFSAKLLSNLPDTVDLPLDSPSSHYCNTFPLLIIDSTMRYAPFVRYVYKRQFRSVHNDSILPANSLLALKKNRSQIVLVHLSVFVLAAHFVSIIIPGYFTTGFELILILRACKGKIGYIVSLVITLVFPSAKESSYSAIQLLTGYITTFRMRWLFSPASFDLPLHRLGDSNQEEVRQVSPK